MKKVTSKKSFWILLLSYLITMIDIFVYYCADVRISLSAFFWYVTLPHRHKLSTHSGGEGRKQALKVRNATREVKSQRRFLNSNSRFEKMHVVCSSRYKWK